MPDSWREAFYTVPRHLFVPDAVWRGTTDGLIPLVREEDPEAWLDLVYSDTAITTQADDGQTAPGEVGRHSSSSSSMPSVVAMMLHRLAVAPGMRVLEIGTGTGWNAALLAARLGDDHVTTVEVDPQVADRARKALADAGFCPDVVTGDGAYGHAPGAPYDRVLATCAVYRVPYAWVEQTRPNGRIVTPWASDYHNGVLLALDVAGDGTASGRFGGNVAFMRMRDQRADRGIGDETGKTVAVSTTTLDVYDVVGDFDGSFAVGLLMPGTHCVLDEHGEQRHTLRLHHPASGSWATVAVEPADAFVVRQHGPHRLWDEVTSAHEWWTRTGRPDHTRFGLTVTRDAQWVWLDSPRNLVTHTGHRNW